jgi:hypothetical protein
MKAHPNSSSGNVPASDAVDTFSREFNKSLERLLTGEE